MNNHILHVTKVEDEESDFVEWTIECPGGSSCHIWYECEEKDCYITFPYADDGDGEDLVDVHGVEHRFIEGTWMTDSGLCGAEVGDVCDAVFEIAHDRGLGNWPVEVDYEGCGTWWLNDLTGVSND